MITGTNTIIVKYQSPLVSPGGQVPKEFKYVDIIYTLF